MRICLLATSTIAHRMGGTEVQAQTLAAEAARQGHSVFVITTAHPSGLKSERRSGCDFIYLEGTSHAMSRRDAPAWWRASAARTAELCRAEKIDVVWAENFSGLSYAALPRASRRPVISVVNGLAVRGEIASSFARVSTISELAYFLTRYAAQTLFYYIPRFRAMVRDSDLLVAVSRETAGALAEEFPGSEGKTRVILNPVDTALFSPDPGLRTRTRAALGISGTETAVIMAGVLHKQKGFHLGIKAFAAASAGFTDARLLIAGDGPQRGELEALAGKAGLKHRILFLGEKPHEELAAFYNAADIYLNPTLRLEGLSLVTVEAMACGLPSVVSRSGGTCSTIIDGESGYFTEPGDTGGMASRLERLLGDPGLRARLSAGARARALEAFDTTRNVAQYIEASRELTRAL